MTRGNAAHMRTSARGSAARKPHCAVNVALSLQHRRTSVVGRGISGADTVRNGRTYCYLSALAWLFGRRRRTCLTAALASNAAVQYSGKAPSCGNAAG